MFIHNNVYLHVHFSHRPGLAVALKRYLKGVTSFQAPERCDPILPINDGLSTFEVCCVCESRYSICMNLCNHHWNQLRLNRRRSSDVTITLCEMRILEPEWGVEDDKKTSV